MAREIVQFVCFETSYDEHRFLPAWTPFASAFLARGLDRIVLSMGLAPDNRFGFISRNLWDEQSFAAAFPGGLPGEAGGFGIVAVQAGGFRLVAGSEARLRDARKDMVKAIALIEFAKDAGNAATLLASALAERAWREVDWTIFETTSPRWRGRFDAVLEAYASPDNAALMMTDIKERLVELHSVHAVDLALYQEGWELP